MDDEAGMMQADKVVQLVGRYWDSIVYFGSWRSRWRHNGADGAMDSKTRSWHDNIVL